MFLEERRSFILEQLHQQGRVSVKELSDFLHVSAVTIRQDLQALESEGRLKRTYGGAVQPQIIFSPSEQSFETRRRKNQAEKEAIARAAAAKVKEGYGIALDASTTAFALTPYLRQMENLVIVTNSLMIAQQFTDCPSIEVFLPAGKFRSDSVSLVGRPETLPPVNFNIGFFGAHGVTLEMGLGEMSQEEAAIKQALIAHCVTTVILVDSSKWGQVAPYTFARPQEVDLIMTTDKTPLLKPFRDADISLEVIHIED